MGELKDLRILKWEIENFMRIEVLTVNAGGQHVLITGENGVGKTSAVDSIFSALRGAGKEIPNPIRKGADKARVRLDLGEIVVERKWTEKSSSLEVTGKDGSRFAKPQTLLDSLMSVATLDPVAFQSLAPKDQVTELLGVVGVLPPVAKVKEIVGEEIQARTDESAYSYLERLAGDGGIYYMRRRDIGRTLDQKKAGVEEQKRQVEALGGPVATTDKQVGVSDLLGQLDALQKQRDAKDAASEYVRNRHKMVADAEAKLNVITDEHKRTEGEIKELEGKLAKLRDQAAVLSGRIAKGHEVVAGLKQDHQKAMKAHADAQDPSAAIQAVKNQIAGLEKATADQARRKQATEQLDRLTGELKRTAEDHKKVDDYIFKIRNLKARLLEGVNLGVEGLAIDEGELRLNSVPFVQASQAQKIKVGCALAMLRRPAIRILRIDEGERLDAESKKLIFDLASERGFEVIMTAVKDSGGLKVEIVEAESPPLVA